MSDDSVPTLTASERALLATILERAQRVADESAADIERDIAALAEQIDSPDPRLARAVMAVIAAHHPPPAGASERGTS